MPEIPKVNDNLDSQYLDNRKLDENLTTDEWFKKTVEQAKAGIGKGEPDFSVSHQPVQPPAKESIFDMMISGYKKNLGTTADILKGTAELGASLVTGATAWPISKAGYLGTSPFWGGEEAKKFEDYLAETYTYQPTTELGKKSTEIVGKALSLPFKPSEWIGELAGKMTGSLEAKYGTTTIAEIATMLLIPKLVGKMKEISGASKKPQPITTEELAQWDKDIKTGVSEKLKKAENARGDLTSEMEKLNQDIHNEIQSALEKIPQEEWEKFDIKKKPHQESLPIIGGTPKGGTLPPEMVSEAEHRIRVAKLQEAFSKPGFQRTASDNLILKEEGGILKPEDNFRSLGDIARDLKTVIDLDQRGSMSLEGLAPDKQAAYGRLSKDLDTISKNAKKTGKTIGQYLMDLGFDPEVVRYITQRAEQAGKKEQMTPVEMGDVRVNLDRISNNESLRNVISDIDLKMQESGRIEETTRGKRSHETTIKASQTERGKVTLQQALARKPGQMWNPEQMQSVRDLRTSAASKVKELTDKVLSGDEKAGHDLASSLVIFGELHAQDVGIGAEVGRALESRKIVSEKGRQAFDPTELATIAQAVKDSAGDPKLLARRIKALEKPEQVSTFVRQLVNGLKKGVNIFNFAWINGLLSGPPTHVVNFATNSSAFLGGIETRRIAGRIGQIREAFGGKPGVEVGEANQMVYGTLEGFMDSLKSAKTAWMENETSFGTGKIENYQKNPLSREALGLTGAYDHSIEFLANTLEIVGKVVGSPGRGLMVADEFWKGLNYRAELHAQAFREATAEGLQGKKFGERVKYITDHPDQFPSIDNAAIEFAEYQTFTQELGPIGKALMKVSNATPFTKIIAPFVRTPIDILKYTQDYTPGLNMMSQRFYSDINAGGARADLALAKMSMGVMFAATTAYLVEQGIIIGNGPYDKKLKQFWLQDHQPNSIKVGDTHIAFDRMDFPGNVIGIVADTMSMVQDLELDDANQILSAVALSTANIMVNKTYLQGLSNFMDAIKSPDKAAKDYVTNFSRSLVPNVIGVANRAFFDQEFKEVNSIFDAIRSRIPGQSENLPPKRGFWGQPVISEGTLGPDMLSPYRIKKDTHDPVNDEILANRMSLSMPPKSLGGSIPSENPLLENQPRAIWGVKLSPEEYDRFVVLAREEVNIGGKNLHDKLEELIQSPSYQRQSIGPDGGRSLLMRTYINQYQQIAEIKLMKEFPDLADKISEQRNNKIQALRPGQ